MRKDTQIVNPGRLMAFLLGLAGVTAAQAATLSFGSYQEIDALNGSALVLTSADLNGDGKPDLMTDDGTLYINTTPDGSATATFSTQLGPVGGGMSVLAADLNGDGLADLISVGATMEVAINISTPGDAAPSFAAPQSFDGGYLMFAAAVGDVDGDGRPDVVVANYGDNTVSVFLNTTNVGDQAASFAAPATYAAGTNARWLALADINGDGKLDVVVDNDMDSTISVLVNATTGVGDATFLGQQVYAVGDVSSMVTVADINGDGKPDVIVANNMENDISILLNTTPNGSPNPSFAAEQLVATGEVPDSVAVTDMDGDGKLDLVVGNAVDNNVSVIPNLTATGSMTLSFDTMQTSEVGTDPESLVAVDLNGDGRPDIATADCIDISIGVLINTTP